MRVSRLAAGALAASLCMLTVQAHAEDGVARPITRLERNPATALAPLGSGTGAASSMGQYVAPANPICTQTWHDGPVHRTDCEGNAPDNETSIAVDPTDPQRLLAAGNDYQLTEIPGAGLGGSTIYTRAMVSEDGGKTWVTHPIPYKKFRATGDPAVAFDADGRAYVATLGFGYSNGGSAFLNPDVIVSHSTDHGFHWSSPTVVAFGAGSWMTPGPSQDKEMITAWGHGNAIVTWTRYLLGKQGAYLQSPIYASVTHDGGVTWSDPVEISGRAWFCVGSGVEAADACDQSQFSWPTRTEDGRLFVTFNTLDPRSTDFDGQQAVVQVSPKSGRLVAGPWRVSRVQDGSADYPVSWFGDLTLQDSQFRVGSEGAIAADPTDAGHLAVVWTDMRNSPSRDQGTDQQPYDTVTNADVMLSESWDAGRHWSAPSVVGADPSNDQFFPSVVFLSDGRLVVGMMDRSYDPANHAYAYSLSLQTASGWQTQNVSGALSDPTMDNRWFTGGQVFPGFAYPTTFIGDYTTVAVDGNVAFPLWTDLRNDTTFSGRTGHDEQFMTTRVAY
ncbi:MAG: sialidase family protein [Planctomycetaceae bacterium]